MNPFNSIKLLQWSEFGSHMRNDATVGIKWLEIAATLCKSGLVSIEGKVAWLVVIEIATAEILTKIVVKRKKRLNIQS